MKEQASVAYKKEKRKVPGKNLMTIDKDWTWLPKDAQRTVGGCGKSQEDSMWTKWEC